MANPDAPNVYHCISVETDPDRGQKLVYIIGELAQSACETLQYYLLTGKNAENIIMDVEPQVNQAQLDELKKPRWTGQSHRVNDGKRGKETVLIFG